MSKIQAFTSIEGEGIRRFNDGLRDRLIRVDKRAASGYVDWDDDTAVLKRALNVAARISKSAGKDTVQSRRQIEEAVDLLLAQGTGQDAYLDLYRLKRAQSLCENTGLLSMAAPELVETLRQHPIIAERLANLDKEIRKNVEHSVREELEKSLADERAALKLIVSQVANQKQEIEQGQRTLQELATQAQLLKRNVDEVANAVEVAIDERVRAAIERPISLLAEVSVLRPLIGMVSQNHVTADSTNCDREKQFNIGWLSRPREVVKDRTAFKKALISIARARGVDPSIMLPLHAAISAQLVPVVMGPRALACLAAYSHAVCGDRLAVLHTSPAFCQPSDLIGRLNSRDSEVCPSSFERVASAATEVDGATILVLEGANRAPLESWLIPLLELREAKIAIRSADLSSELHLPDGLRLSATVVDGATTVPVSPQLWLHAVALRADAELAVPCNECYDLPLSSELFYPGDIPQEPIDEILEAWPEGADLKIALERYGSALARFYSDGKRIYEALLHGLVCPYIATALDDDEQEDAVSKLGFASDSNFASALSTLRKRLR